MIVRHRISVWAAILVVLACTPRVAASQPADPNSRTAGSPAEHLTRPWRTGDPAPSIEGIHLGDTKDTVISVLGTPAPIPPDLAASPTALQPLRFRGGALIIGVSKTEGVVRILLRKPEGGALDGIRVGDRLGALVRRWGEPTAGYGSVGRYPMGKWTVSVRGDMGTNVVLSILLARSATSPIAPPATSASAGH